MLLYIFYYLILKAILQDLFPGVDIPEHDYGKLQSAIEHCILAKGLQVCRCFSIISWTKQKQADLV